MRSARLTVVCGLVAAALATAAPAADATATIAPSNVAVGLSSVASGFGRVTYVTSSRDGTHRLFVVEKAGRVMVVKNGAVQTTPYLSITGRVLSSGNEQGLLSIAFHPDFKQHPYVFVAYTRQSDGALMVSRFHASSYSASTVSASSEVKLFVAPHPNQQNHNGGQLMFGAGGLMYVTTGDGGGAGDPYRNAENLSSLLGKILRLDVDHRCYSRQYCIPASNPFAKSTSAVKRLVFDWGLRNPWRDSVDRADGSLWIGDVGQDAWEEVDHVGTTGGKDFGWSCMEGPVRYPGGASCSGRHMTKPITYYDHSNGRCAVIGGYAYHGPTYTFAHGLYVFADYCSGEVWAVGRTSTGGYNRALVDRFSGNITGFGEGDTGEIYAVTDGGGLYHVTWRRR